MYEVHIDLVALLEQVQMREVEFPWPTLEIDTVTISSTGLLAFESTSIQVPLGGSSDVNNARKILQK